MIHITRSLIVTLLSAAISTAVAQTFEDFPYDFVSTTVDDYPVVYGCAPELLDSETCTAITPGAFGRLHPTYIMQIKHCSDPVEFYSDHTIPITPTLQFSYPFAVVPDPEEGIEWPFLLFPSIPLDKRVKILSPEVITNEACPSGYDLSVSNLMTGEVAYLGKVGARTDIKYTNEILHPLSPCEFFSGEDTEALASDLQSLQVSRNDDIVDIITSKREYSSLDEQSLIPDQATSEIILDVNIAPNPAHNFATIFLKDHSGPAEISIFNSQGKLVETVKGVAASTTLDVSHLQAGLHTIVVATEFRSTTSQFLKD